MAGYYLWSAHPQQFFAALPFLAFLACPLMMLFMMRGVGGMGSGGDVDGLGNQGSEPSVSPRPKPR